MENVCENYETASICDCQICESDCPARRGRTGHEHDRPETCPNCGENNYRLNFECCSKECGLQYEKIQREKRKLLEATSETKSQNGQSRI